MNRIRTLQDPLGKTWGTRCEEADLIVRTGAPGKEKETIKPQADARAAVAQAQKEEWARLKKGFVLVDAAARRGEPRMHRFLGAGYTGAMPVADFGGRLLCSRNLASPVHPGAAGRDQLVVIDADAKEIDAFEAPENTLVWKAQHMPSQDLLLLLADDGVLAWSPASRSFDTLAEDNRDPASFLSIADDRAAWFAQPELIVCALPARGARAVLFRQPAEPRLFSGHSMQMEGALSAQGAFAFCTQPGEVRFVDLSGGEPPPPWRGDFAMIDKLCYTPDGRWLIAKERYGRWTLHCFDMQARAPRADWPALGDLANGDFALDPAGARVAIAHRGRIDVYEFATMKPVLGFAVDHVVKRCTIAWIGDDTLGVRTDAGCASLYAVGAPAA